MRIKAVPIFLLLAIVFSLSACKTDKATLQDRYGEYGFSDLVAVSALSSMSADGMRLQKQDAACTLKSDLFELKLPFRTIRIERPVYEPAVLPADDTILVLINSEEIQTVIKSFDAAYYVINDEGDKIGFKIYLSSRHPDKIWIADFADNTADHSDIIVQSLDEYTHKKD